MFTVRDSSYTSICRYSKRHTTATRARLSTQLLNHLNGNNSGLFSEWLKTVSDTPKIAWYPSAGVDFRDLLFLHPKYVGLNPSETPEPAAPDLFIHTDYFPWKESNFLEKKNLFQDGHTKITIDQLEELPSVDLPQDSQIVTFPNVSQVKNIVVFMWLRIESHLLGDFKRPLIYIFSENAAFCAEILLAEKARISHIIHIRYGAGFGGGRSSGIWLLNVLHQLKCEAFLTDQHWGRLDGDRRVYKLYPQLRGNEDTSDLICRCKSMAIAASSS